MFGHLVRLVLAALLGALMVSGAQAATLKVGSNSQRSPARPTCEAYPGVQRDLGGKVFRIPPGDCDVSDMTIAVVEEGRFRPTYGPRRTIAAVQAIDPVIRRLRAQAAALPPGEPLRILFFSHGGLVSHANAVEQAESLAPAMLTDGFQPVFLIWNSDLVNSYRDRLCCVRDGEHDLRLGFSNAAARLAGDVGASVVRAPQNFGGQGLRFYESVIVRDGTKYYLHPDDPAQFCSSLNGTSCPAVVFPPYPADPQLNGRGRSFGREVNYTLLAPFRVATTLLLPEAGAKGWDNMVRRTRMAFQRSAPLSPAERAACATHDDPKGYGGFAVFLDRLACELEIDPKTGAATLAIGDRKVPVELHFYGHSMGALVGDEALSLHPELPWKTLVYMAAASTIRDFRLTAAPTLLAHPDAQFFNLVLHPLNESRELQKGGVLPQGSLLEWIDEMFEGPRTPDERTLGKWTNFRNSAGTLPDALRRRTTVRVFAKQLEAGVECGVPPGVSAQAPPPCNPVRHGDFDDFSFWRDAYRLGPPAAAGSEAVAR